MYFFYSGFEGTHWAVERGEYQGGVTMGASLRRRPASASGMGQRQTPEGSVFNLRVQLAWGPVSFLQLIQMRVVSYWRTEVVVS